MGLKFSDALRLSWSNIAQHKKRSAIIILTISVLFGVVMGFNFIASGIEETTIAASAGQTGGEVYAWTIYTGNKNGDDDDYHGSIFEPEEVSGVSLVPVLNEADDVKLRERVSEYGGEVAGYYWSYQMEYTYKVIEKSVVEDFITEDLSEVPEGMVPVLMPEGFLSTIDNEDLVKRLESTLYRVGEIPGTEEGKPTLSGANPLNLILGQLPGATNDTFWIIDDGSGKVLPYIEGQLKEYLTGGQGWYEKELTYKTMVAKFSDPYQAVAYASPEDEALGVKLYTNYKYHAQDLFGTTLAVAGSFNTQRALLIAVEILLLVVAAIVAIMTFAHLIDSDAATVALYRAMGASTGNIYLIYFLYLVELCLLAIVAGFVIAFIFIAIMAVTSAGALAVRLQEFYKLSYLPKVTLFLFNKMFWLILVIIMLVAPISLLFTRRRFSAKHIAKKLKED